MYNNLAMEINRSNPNGEMIKLIQNKKNETF